MSVLFFDSFDHYTNNAPDFLNALKREYTCNFPYHTPYLLAGRHSNYALYLGSLGVTNYISKKIEQSNDMTFFIMGFQFKKIGNQNYTGLSISFAPIPVIYESYEYDIFAYNKLLFHDNKFKFITVSETSPVMATINDEEWHHVEMKMYYPGTGTWSFYVDGVQTGTWSPTTTLEWNETIKFEISTINAPFLTTNDVSKGWYIDDFYLLDDFGPIYNNIIGTNARIETLKPTQDVVAQSDIINTTYGYQSQDNIGVNNSQYIKTIASHGATGNVSIYDKNSTFEYENLSTIRNIGALKQNSIAVVDNETYIWPYDFAFLKNNQEVGATISKPHKQHDPFNAFKSTIFNNNPQTDTNWTISDINSSNFGFKSKVPDIKITQLKDSFGDLYYPDMTDNYLQCESNAYIFMLGSTLVNPDANLWETIDTSYLASYMLVKRKLNGLENDSQIAALQSVTNHSFALMFITSSKDENFYFINQTTASSGNQAFPIFNYQHAVDRHTILPIRILAPTEETSVAGTYVLGDSLWTNISSGLSYSKFYYLTNCLREDFPDDYAITPDSFGIMTALPVVAPTAFINLFIAK